jgi:hypothetical protein
MAPIPLENLVERPSAKTAVGVVENDVTFHQFRDYVGDRNRRRGGRVNPETELTRAS